MHSRPFDPHQRFILYFTIVLGCRPFVFKSAGNKFSTVLLCHSRTTKIILEHQIYILTSKDDFFQFNRRTSID